MKKRKKGAVTDRSQAVNGLVNQVRNIHGPRDAIRVLGWSKRIAGIEIGERCKSRNCKPYSKAAVIRWCHRRGSRWYLPLNREQLNAWGMALDEWVHNQDARLRFDMTVNSPWKCTLLAQDERGKWQRVDLRRKVLFPYRGDGGKMG